MSATSSTILATTQEEWLSRMIQETFFDDSESTFTAVKNAKGRAKVDGGESVTWPFESGQVGTAGFIPSSGSFASATGEFAKKASLAWKIAGIAPKREAIDFDVLNRGQARVINAMEGWLDNSRNSMKERVGAAFWANTDPAVATDDFVSIPNAIHSTADYAGQTVGANPKWASIFLDKAGNDWSVDDVSKIIHELRFIRGAKGKMTLYCGLEPYQMLEREANAAVRHPAVRTGVKTALNVDTFSISGVDVVCDRYLNESAANGAFAVTDPRGVAGARKGYFIVEEHLVYVPQPATELEGFKMDKEGWLAVGKPTYLGHTTREHAIQMIMQSTGVLAYLNRRHAAVVSRIGV